MIHPTSACNCIWKPNGFAYPSLPVVCVIGKSHINKWKISLFVCLALLLFSWVGAVHALIGSGILCVYLEVS